MLKTKSQGYLMIEVLVMVVIFSISIITLTLLQTKSSAGVNSSNYRGIAINYSQNLFDKIRANKAGLVNGSYLTGTMTNNSCESFDDTVSSCSATQLAQNDLFYFNATVVATLPAGAWVLCIDSLNAQGTPTSPNCNGVGNNYVVKIFWKDKLSKAINTNSGYSQVIIGTQI